MVFGVSKISVTTCSVNKDNAIEYPEKSACLKSGNLDL